MISTQLEKSLASEDPASYRVASEKTNIHTSEGMTLAASLDLKFGQKVIDMGCGLGQISAFMADQVGEEGCVVGVDPDEERIKVAIVKHCSQRSENHLTFIVGDSSSHFPHYDQEYYDVHFSNYSFQFIPPQEKVIFLTTAYRCLKPGGRIVVNTRDRNNDLMEAAKDLLLDDGTRGTRVVMHPVMKCDLERMMQDFGFLIECSNYAYYENVFKNVDSFLTWLYDSVKLDKSKILPEKKEDFIRKFAREDGTILLKKTATYIIIARKPNI